MKKILDVFKLPNIECGYLYFYIHFVTEVVCFYFLTYVTKSSNFIWLIPFVYDGLAFVPQAIIGRISDKFSKINFSIIGMVLMILAYIMYFGLNLNIYIALVSLCIGNAFIHVNGAEVTLKASQGKLSHSSIFVAGGSFGVITGKLLTKINGLPFWMIILFSLTLIPYIKLADTFVTDEDDCSDFNYVTSKINPGLIILFAIFVVIVRGYMGYGIPTAWNKTVFQTVLLYVTMGIGKAFGGVLSDAYGIRKTAFFSTFFSIPFLCFGDNIMFVSLIGVMLFSMTMSITLAILVSVLKDTPGLAFGLTTIGLFLGTLPIFFVSITNSAFNIGFIVLMSIVCNFVLMSVLKKEGIENEMDIQ